MTSVKWEAQEADAVRLLRQFLARAFAFELSAEDARALRGLSRDEYPADAASAARLGSIIEQLVPRVVAPFAGSDADVDGIRADAGVRLWLLSALALRRGSARALPLAVKAFATSPASLAAFAAKAARRVRGG
jgi:hypothetical protein